MAKGGKSKGGSGGKGSGTKPKGPGGLPSKTGKPSGKGRDNDPPQNK